MMGIGWAVFFVSVFFYNQNQNSLHPTGRLAGDGEPVAHDPGVANTVFKAEEEEAWAVAAPPPLQGVTSSASTHRRRAGGAVVVAAAAGPASPPSPSSSSSLPPPSIGRRGRT